ncbi:hypothetical protein [Bradyrhizobium elkanii]|uniref:hypothetical protein n=1 Tax=Bradyrhizobium elkanii TaxID=29448 RepID=UPI001BADE2F1|nr:hypothetical protein [Bradyrhizobium elkanii]MBR1159766.1 hypothetical protein [Bradyrhizobium elkanii]
MQNIRHNAVFSERSSGETAMRMTVWLVAACALTLAAPARAERPDCGSFPDTRSRLTCYENVSRAPPEPEVAAQSPGAHGKSMKMNARKRRHK